MPISKAFPFWIFAFALAACSSSADQSDVFQLNLPPGYTEPVFPKDNELTASRVELGRRLFFDKTLSVDSSLSCASCHLPAYGFADTLSFSLGFEGQQTMRNTPTLINIAYQKEFMMDGGVPSLELQAMAPLGDEAEMAFNMMHLVDRIGLNPNMVRKLDAAYGRHDSYAIVRALAAFQRTLIAPATEYDTAELNENQKRGERIFQKNCASCHNGFVFSNFAYENIGLYENYAPDTGRARITWEDADVGRFKVPMLRQVSKTAPYMHDGSLATLEEVIEHYNSGGKNHRNKSPKIKVLNLSEREKADLLEFLKAL
jgi:cytochrome c peroxidase